MSYDVMMNDMIPYLAVKKAKIIYLSIEEIS